MSIAASNSSASASSSAADGGRSRLAIGDRTVRITDQPGLQRNPRHWQPGAAKPAAVPIAPNGIAYLPDYKNWQAISTTERFDNGTMRVVFGNAVAVKAIREKHINPWPNGTAFAKVAWDQLADAEGNVRPGAFKQVEYMLKDDQKYAATKGWGWARFKTPKMVPYGKDALFTTECINCHQPMKNNDFVFTQPLNHYPHARQNHRPLGPVGAERL